MICYFFAQRALVICKKGSQGSLFIHFPIDLDVFFETFYENQKK